MKIYITGGAGMIGQAVARRHLAAGDEVFIYDERLNPYPYRYPVGCVGQWSHRLSDILEIKPDVVSVHAALVAVGDSQLRPAHYLLNNVGHAARVVEVLRSAGNWRKRSRILYAGSMGPYGNRGDTSSMIESDSLLPCSQYAVSKMAAESCLKIGGKSLGMQVVSLRYFSVYADDSNPFNPNTGVLSMIGGKILRDDVIELNEDGKQTRDLIHADDCALAHMYFSRYLPNLNFEAVNIGTGISYSLRAVASWMMDVLGCKKKLRFNGIIRDGDVRHCRADTTLAASLGWTATVRLEERLPVYCEYLKALQK